MSAYSLAQEKSTTTTTTTTLTMRRRRRHVKTSVHTLCMNFWWIIFHVILSFDGDDEYSKRQFGVARARRFRRCHRRGRLHRRTNISMLKIARGRESARTARGSHLNVTSYFAFCAFTLSAHWNGVCVCVRCGTVWFLIEPLFSSVPFPEMWKKERAKREREREIVCIFHTHTQNTKLTLSVSRLHDDLSELYRYIDSDDNRRTDKNRAFERRWQRQGTAIPSGVFQVSHPQCIVPSVSLLLFGLRIFFLISFYMRRIYPSISLSLSPVSGNGSSQFHWSVAVVRILKRIRNDLTVMFY